MIFQRVQRFLFIPLLTVWLLASVACGGPPAAAPAPAPIAAVPTTALPAAVTAVQNTPLWAGPSESYAQVGGLATGQTAEIIGRDETASFWVVRFAAAADGRAWVATSAVAVQGDVANVPLVMAPALPTATATAMAPVVEEGDAAVEAPVEPTAVPTATPEPALPEVAATEVAPQPTATATAELVIVVQPTATAELVIVVQPTATTALGVAPVPTATLPPRAPMFVQQPSYTANCAERPANTICVGFTDGYVWLVEDTLLAWTTGDAYQGQAVAIAEGAKGFYHHVLNTNLVKFVPKN